MPSVLVICFCVPAAIMAALSFLSFVEKTEARITFSWRALLRHVAVCIILMMLCSTACRNAPKYSGFFLALCYVFYYLKCTAQIMRNRSHALKPEKGQLPVIILFAVLFSGLFFVLCTYVQKAEFMLFAVLLAPFYGILSLHMQTFLNTFFSSCESIVAVRKRRRAKNLICIAVAGRAEQEACIHFLSNILQKKSLVLKKASLFALSDLIRTDLDSTVRFLIFALPQNVKTAKQMLRLAAPRCVLLCDVKPDDPVAALACRIVKGSGTVIMPADKSEAFSGSVRKDVLVRTYFDDRHDLSDVVFCKVRSTQNGMAFTAKERVTQQKYDGMLRLIGTHNIRAAACAVTCSGLFGVSFEQAIHRVCAVEPLYRKLSADRLAQGAMWIDDAAQCTMADIRYAFETLDAFDGRKIGVLGSFSILESNKQLGRLAAEHIQIAVLCGDGADAVQCGLIEAGFTQENIFYVQSAAHLRRMIHQLVQSDDVILQVLTQFNYMEVL